VVDLPQIEKILQGSRNGTALEESCQKLIDAAKAAGGPDNVTAVLVRKVR
jgi:serine/threonine protein phosphatase PrpC